MPRLAAAWRRVPPDLRAALPGWVVARAAVGLGMLVALVVADKLVPGSPPIQLSQGLFAWDGAFYRDIAAHGYDDVAREALRFFPLLPMLGALVAVPLLGAVGPALVIVSNGAALAAGALLHRLARFERGDDGLATQSAWLLALLPPALVLVLAYSESLMLLFSICAFIGYRRQRWWSAALCGVLAGLSRPIGGLLVVPALIEGLRGFRTASRADRLGRLAALVGPVVGVVSYLAWVHVRFGDWRLPEQLQSTDELRGEYVFPLVRVAQAIGGVFTEPGRESLHVPWILLFIGLTIVAFRKWPASYGAFAAVLLFVALSSENLGSFERYGLTAFPLVLALASITARPVIDRMVLTASAAGLAAFTTMTMLGTFVP